MIHGSRNFRISILIAILFAFETHANADDSSITLTCRLFSTEIEKHLETAKAKILGWSVDLVKKRGLPTLINPQVTATPEAPKMHVEISDAKNSVKLELLTEKIAFYLSDENTKTKVHYQELEELIQEKFNISQAILSLIQKAALQDPDSVSQKTVINGPTQGTRLILRDSKITTFHGQPLVTETKYELLGRGKKVEASGLIRLECNPNEPS